MAVQSHISELSEKHRVLDKQIEHELAKPASDDLKIAAMKRMKLRIKDRINSLRRKFA